MRHTQRNASKQREKKDKATEEKQNQTEVTTQALPAAESQASKKKPPSTSPTSYAANKPLTLQQQHTHTITPHTPLLDITQKINKETEEKRKRGGKEKARQEKDNKDKEKKDREKKDKEEREEKMQAFRNAVSEEKDRKKNKENQQMPSHSAPNFPQKIF